jgi:hypothetical protein
MREDDSCIDTLVMDYPKCVKIVVKGVTDDDGIAIDKCVKGFAYRR